MKRSRSRQPAPPRATNTQPACQVPGYPGGRKRANGSPHVRPIQPRNGFTPTRTLLAAMSMTSPPLTGRAESRKIPGGSSETSKGATLAVHLGHQPQRPQLVYNPDRNRGNHLRIDSRNRHYPQRQLTDNTYATPIVSLHLPWFTLTDLTQPLILNDILIQG